MALQEKAYNISENIVKFLDASTSNMIVMTIAGHLKDISENISYQKCKRHIQQHTLRKVR